MAEENKNSQWLKEVLRPLQPMYREVVVTSLFVNSLALAVPVADQLVVEAHLDPMDRGSYNIGLRVVRELF